MGRAKLVKMSEDALNLEALEEAGRILRAGGLVAFPTERYMDWAEMPWIRRHPGKFTRQRADRRTIR